MTTVNDFIKLFDLLFPFKLAQQWDNVGLLVGRGEKNVSKVLLTLDVDEKVAAEASELGCDLIISHHPLMFKSISRLTDQTPEQRTLRILVENDIALLSAHTNLDCAEGGLNDFLAEKLKITNTQIVDICGEVDGKIFGFGRIGILEQGISLENFLKLISKNLDTKGIRYCGNLKKTVKRIAVNCGGGGDALAKCIDMGADVFVTGDVKYNPFRDAYENDFAIIDAGHYETENIVLELFENVLVKNTAGVTIYKSKSNVPVIKYFVD
ncbi:MAG: Nif3-like dinuclear metal center hexameric protein [Clostridia bacterium]|nr:Nif3-like dinuclear metal center hexameric protein [Clostridia bacterium]